VNFAESCKNISGTPWNMLLAEIFSSFSAMTTYLHPLALKSDGMTHTLPLKYKFSKKIDTI
jgi:hypothetical protein